MAATLASITTLVFLILSISPSADAQDPAWQGAHATLYTGGNDTSGTVGGGCGYGDPVGLGYGENTVSLSPALFNAGQTCGACFEIMCDFDPQTCLPGSIVVSATSFCPPNPALPIDNGGWCNPPLPHFDMAEPAFLKIARSGGPGIIPVAFRRVPCVKVGGMRFTINGSENFNVVLISNVAGASDVKAVSVKGSGTGSDWMVMSRNWGQNWQISAGLRGQSLSFQVTSSDGKTVTSLNVAPAGWQFGQTFTGAQF